MKILDAIFRAQLLASITRAVRPLPPRDIPPSVQSACRAVDALKDRSPVPASHGADGSGEDRRELARFAEQGLEVLRDHLCPLDESDPEQRLADLLQGDRDLVREVLLALGRASFFEVRARRGA